MISALMWFLCEKWGDAFKILPFINVFLKLSGLLTLAFANRRREDKNKAIAPQLYTVLTFSKFLLFLLLSTNSVKQEHTFDP